MVLLVVSLAATHVIAPVPSLALVLGANIGGTLPALMDDSASRELWRHTRSNVLIINPDAPGTLEDRPSDAEPAAQGA